MKESFPVPSEQAPSIIPQEQEVAALEEEDRNINLYADTILAAARKNGAGEFLSSTLSQLGLYAKGERDEQRQELFAYWSNEELQELRDKILLKMREDLGQNK